MALTILVAVLMAGWFLVAAPLIGLVTDRQTDIAAMADRLTHLRAVIARVPALKRREQVLQAQFSAEGGFWKGPSAAAVAASVQDRLRQVVTGSGGLVKSTSETRPTSEHDTRIVRLRFRIEGTLDTVQSTLAAIQTMRPSLFVDALSIVGSEGPVDPAKSPVLDLDLEVSGYMPAVPS
jgi:hypothetical protein